MAQTVYIDVLFFVNFAVDILIFLSVSVIMRRKEKWWRYIIASVLGAAYSCAVFFSDISPAITNTGAILLYCAACRFIFQYKSKKLFLRGVIITVLCASVYGGLIFMLYLFTGIGSVMTFSNGALYIDIPVFTMLIFCFIAYGILWLVSAILSNRAPKECFVDVRIELNGQQLALKGFIDTGNKLSDPIGGLPLIIVSLEKLRPLLPQSLADFLDTGDTRAIPTYWKKRIRPVPCSTVSGGKLLYALKCDELYINNIRAGECLAAVINKKLTQTNEYDALIPVSVMNTGGGNNERITEKNIHSDMQAFG